MANDRNAGRKHKFKNGGKMVNLQLNRSVPEKAKEQIKKAIDETINQFRDYDWT